MATKLRNVAGDELSFEDALAEQRHKEMLDGFEEIVTSIKSLKNNNSELNLLLKTYSELSSTFIEKLNHVDEGKQEELHFEKLKMMRDFKSGLKEIVDSLKKEEVRETTIKIIRDGNNLIQSMKIIK